MTYLRDNEKRKKRNRIFILLIAAALLFYYQHEVVYFFSGSVSAVAGLALKETSSAKEGASQGLLALVSFKSSLIAENNELKNKLNESGAKLLDYDRLVTENLELKALLGREDGSKLLLAGIIAKPNQSPYDTLVLDAGGKEGVFAGASVLAYGNVVIGRISEVSDNMSKAVLFSSPGEENGGVISGRNISIKLYGRGGGNFASEIPRGVSVGYGDRVYSAGLFPYLLGTVENVSSDPRDPFQSVIFKNPVNIAELRFVEILIP